MSDNELLHYKLSEFLRWIITPQNELEQEKFKKVVDDYIELNNRIDDMSITQLMDEIDNQLKYLKLEIDRDQKLNEILK